MAPTEQKPNTLAEAMEMNYMAGGPSQFWLARCRRCRMAFSGRSQRAVLDNRNDHEHYPHEELSL